MGTKALAEDGTIVSKSACQEVKCIVGVWTFILPMVKILIGKGNHS